MAPVTVMFRVPPETGDPSLLRMTPVTVAPGFSSRTTWLGSSVTTSNLSSAPVKPEVDEYPVSELETAPSVYVKPPRVASAPAAFECRHWKTIELPDVVPGQPGGHYVVFGEVVGIYIDDAYVNDGLVDTGAMRPMARLGYMQYSVVTPETVFDINRPQVDENGQVQDDQAKAWDGKYR